MLSLERQPLYLTADDSQSLVDGGALAVLEAVTPSHLPLRGWRGRRVVVSDTALRDHGTADMLAALALAGAHFVRMRDYYEHSLRRVPLHEIDESWFLFDQPLQARRIYETAKRLMDIAFGLVGSAFVLLAIPVLWLLVRLDDGGPLFFRQERVGLAGRSIHIWKFRSMRVDAEADGPAWASADDDRVTRLGAFLRRSRLDETPQFFNVLLGDMSVVGPRPERPVFVQTLGRAIPFYDRRHMTKPGITGWATVRFGYGDSVTDKFRSHEFDLYYLKHRTLLLDLEIILRTIIVMALRRGQ